MTVEGLTLTTRGCQHVVVYRIKSPLWKTVAFRINFGLVLLFVLLRHKETSKILIHILYASTFFNFLGVKLLVIFSVCCIFGTTLLEQNLEVASGSNFFSGVGIVGAGGVWQQSEKIDPLYTTQKKIMWQIISENEEP